MKRLKKGIKTTFVVIFVLFFLSVYFFGTKLESESVAVRLWLGFVLIVRIAVLCVCYNFWYKLQEAKIEASKNYNFSFPRRSDAVGDTTLADLSLDYGLTDEELKEFLKNALHDADGEYRKKHDLDYVPSNDVHDFKMFLM